MLHLKKVGSRPVEGREEEETNEIKTAIPLQDAIEIRKIWVTTKLNDYLKFPHVGQAFMMERFTIDKKSGEEQSDIVYGITSKPPDLAMAQHVLQDNRGHWTIENRSHYIIP